jgi:hypothetical protein
VKVDPLIVATTELFIPSDTVLLAPPSTIVIPVPDVSDLSLDKDESFPIVTKAEVDGARLGADIVTAPEEPEEIVTLLPATR